MSVFAMQLGVEQRIFWRNRSSVFFTFVLPIVLLLALAFSGDPIDNVPFIVALGAISTGFQGLAIQLSMHREQGVLKLLMSTPLRATTLVAAKAASTFVTVLLSLIVVMMIAVIAFDARMPVDPLVLVVSLVLGVAAFVAMGFALASIIPSGDAAPAIANGAYLGLLMLTILLSSVDGLPTALHAVGDLLPLGPLIDSIDHAWMGPSEGIPWTSWATLVAWCALATAWTTRRFRWEPADER